MNDIPEWASERAQALAKDETLHEGYTRTHRAFARYIAEHEEPPVDPLLLEARELCARQAEGDLGGNYGLYDAQGHREGKWDDTFQIDLVKAALKRGMELARKAKP